MPLSGTPAPPNKRKKAAKIITDLSHVSQNEHEEEPEGSELNLGTKIRAPREIMLEELSLMKNKGSQMFKLRQARVEKFIYENNPDVFTSESMDNLQKFVPGIGGQMMDAGGCLVSGQMVGHVGLGGAPVPPPKPGSLAKGAGAGGLSMTSMAAGGAGQGGAGLGGLGGLGGGAGGQGGLLGVGGQGGKAGEKTTKKREYVKTYISPWEKAMKGNEELMATLKTQMPGPYIHEDLPKYKCFNRSAIPFGGFEKASKLMTFQLPEAEAKEEPEPAVVYHQDISTRPSFNRTPIGWVTSGGEAGTIHMEMDTIPFDGETDEL